MAEDGTRKEDKGSPRTEIKDEEKERPGSGIIREDKTTSSSAAQ